MHRPTVFLIGGFSRVGKDTLADRIAAITNARKVAFADSLKNAGNRFFTGLGIESVNLNEDADKVRHRELLVAMGRAARAVDVDIFARHAAEIARYNILAGRCVVIPDWRYLNESQVVTRIVSPAKVVTVLLYRFGARPANPEEEQSLGHIEKNIEAGWIRSFDTGDMKGIDDFAHELVAHHCPIVPAA